VPNCNIYNMRFMFYSISGQIVLRAETISLYRQIKVIKDIIRTVVWVLRAEIKNCKPCVETNSLTSVMGIYIIDYLKKNKESRLQFTSFFHLYKL
jgi:hypothetical protein